MANFGGQRAYENAPMVILVGENFLVTQIPLWSVGFEIVTRPNVYLLLRATKGPHSCATKYLKKEKGVHCAF